MEYVPRHLTVTIRRALRSFPAVLVTGARQTGKTTLLREEFGQRFGFVSLERPDVRARAAADPMAFFNEHPPPLILDEIQYAPELLHYVKERIDARREPGQWLLSGSQSFPLMKGVSQTLAGRVAVLNLDPLSVDEAAPLHFGASLDQLIGHIFDGTSRGRLDRDLGDWLLRGGYPEVRLKPKVDRQLWFSSYVQTYLQRDVRDLLAVDDIGAFARFLALAAARTGNLLNMTELARDAGVTGPTVKRWLSVLEASQIVYLLRPYHRNFGKRMIKSPKLFFVDPGLVTYLTGLHTREAILNGPSVGALAETAVVTEWLKAFRQRGDSPTVYFWRGADGTEVDLLIERGGALFAVEVKATATPTPHHAESLAQWLKLTRGRARAVLACRIDKPTTLRPGIRAVPWHLAW